MVSGAHIGHIEPGGTFAFSAPQWDAAKNEVTFFSVAPEAKPDYNIKFTPLICFAGDAPLRGHPVLPVLYALRNGVEIVLRATEAKCIEIGILKP